MYRGLSGEKYYDLYLDLDPPLLSACLVPDAPDGQHVPTQRHLHIALAQAVIAKELPGCLLGGPFDLVSLFSIP